MMKFKKFLALLLCLVLVFSVTFSSCREDPELPETPETPEEQKPSDESQEDEKNDMESQRDPSVWWKLETLSVPMRYVRENYADWKDAVLWVGDRFGITEWGSDWSNNYMNPPDEMDLKYLQDKVFYVNPNDTVILLEPRFVSSITTSAAVYEFLESRDTSKRQFLIQLAENLKDDFRSNRAERDATLTQLSAQYMSQTQVIADIGFVFFEGTGTELLELLEDYEKNAFVMLHEEFDDVFGVTIEQAQLLISNGTLDLWCNPLASSPLYGLTPTEIAAYLAAHPEILEGAR